MKHMKTPSFKRLWILPALLMVGFAFTQCADKDLEFLDPFQFVNNDFEGLVLPTINDPAPAAVVPPTAQVVVPNQTVAIVNDVSGATRPEDITDANKTNLNNVDNAVEALPVTQRTIIETEAAALTPARIDAIMLQPNAVAPASQAAVNALLQNPAIRSLFPSVTLPAPAPGNREFSIEEIEEAFGARIETLVGPCADAAREAYNRAIAEITADRNAKQSAINATATTRTQEANARRTTRDQAINTLYNNLNTNARNTALSLLTAANAIRPLDAELAEEIRIYTFVYLVTWTNAITSGRTADLAASQAALTTDLANITAARTTATNALTTAFNNQVAEANRRLNAALNACHNQGTGG